MLFRKIEPLRTTGKIIGCEISAAALRSDTFEEILVHARILVFEAKFFDKKLA